MSDSPTNKPDLLGTLVRTAYQDDELATERECASPAWWYEQQAGFLEAVPAHELAAILEHAESCARCSAERELAHQFVQEQLGQQPFEQEQFEEEQFEQEQRVEDRGDNVISFSSGARGVTARTHTVAHKETTTGSVAQRRNRLTGWLAAAAVLVAAIGTYSVSLSRAPEILAPGNGAVLRSQAIEAVRPTGTLTESPLEFEWIDHNQLGQYRLLVTRVDDRIVLERTVEGTSLVLSAQELAELEPFVRYRWTIEATTASGATVQSLPVDFRIAPSQLP